MNSAGFTKDGKRYIRVVNGQICQAFDFQGFSSGDCFTLNVSLFALCEREIHNGNPMFIPMDMRVGFLLQGSDIWWDYSDKSAEEVTEIILNKLLPIFERINTCKAYYREVESAIKPDYFGARNYGSLAEFLLGIKQWGNFTWVCLKAGDYDKAMMCADNQLKRLEKQHIDAVERMQEIINQTPDDSKYMGQFKQSLTEENERYEKNASYYKLVQTKLSNGEYDDLLAEANRVEEKNMNCLKAFCVNA